MLKEVVSNNGSQFDCNSFRKFSKEYQFRHITSTLYYPKSNGEAERRVKTVKALLKKDDEPCLALLTYRSTPLSSRYSPAELLMNRKFRTNVPSSSEAWKLHVLDIKLLVEWEEEMRWKQKGNFDI